MPKNRAKKKKKETLVTEKERKKDQADESGVGKKWCLGSEHKEGQGVKQRRHRNGGTHFFSGRGEKRGRRLLKPRHRSQKG